MHATRNAKSVAIAQILKLTLNMISLITVSRLLAPAEFGLFAMITAVLGIGELFRDAGLSLSAIRAPTLSSKQQANLFWINVAIGAGLTGLGVALSGPVAALYAQPGIGWAVAVVASTFLVNGAAAQLRVRLVREDRFSSLAVADIASQAAALTVAILLAASGAGLTALVAQAVGQAVLALVFVAVMARWLPGLPARRQGMRPLLGFGANLLGTQVLSYLGRNVDNILLGRFSGAVALGLYSKAYTLYALPQQVALAPFTDLVVRTLSTSLGTAHDLYLHRIRTVQTAANYVTLLIFGTMIALAHPIVLILLGPAWSETAVLLQILSIGGCFQLIGYVNFWIFLTEGMSALHLRMTLVTQPVAIACIVAGVPFGAVGVAWGATVGLFVEWVVPATFGTARSSVSARSLLVATIRPVCFALGVSVFVWAASLLVPPVAAFQMLAGMLGGLVWLGGALALWRGLRRDLQVMIGLGSGLLMRRSRQSDSAAA